MIIGVKLDSSFEIGLGPLPNLSDYGISSTDDGVGERDNTNDLLLLAK